MLSMHATSHSVHRRNCIFHFKNYFIFKCNPDMSSQMKVYFKATEVWLLAADNTSLLRLGEDSLK